jgi:hypothetical protein
MTKLKQRGIELYNWMEHRLGLAKPIVEAAEHPIPASSASWWYVFGSAAMVLLGLQVVTGILLALVYVPSASEAWNSLQFLNHNITLGWFLRAVHGWGSNFMIAIVLIHMAQVFLFGAYKFPRELTWIVGVLLLLLTLGMAFTGQVLRFDQDAYWGLGIGASIMSRVPGVGGLLVHALLGGPIIGGATLSRFFALHVFVIPGILLRASACMCGWCFVWASMSGRCRAVWCGNPPMSANITNWSRGTAYPLCRMPYGKTLSLRRPSCSPSSPALSSSARSVRPGSRIPPSFKPPRNPISRSSGSTPSWRSCRRVWKRPSCSLLPIMIIGSLLLLPLSPEKEKSIGRAALWRC